MSFRPGVVEPAVETPVDMVDEYQPLGYDTVIASMFSHALTSAPALYHRITQTLLLYHAETLVCVETSVQDCCVHEAGTKSGRFTCTILFFLYQ